VASSARWTSTSGIPGTAERKKRVEIKVNINFSLRWSEKWQKKFAFQFTFSIIQPVRVDSPNSFEFLVSKLSKKFEVLRGRDSVK